MGIVNKFFGKEIDRKIQEGVKKAIAEGTNWASMHGVKDYKQGKFQNAQGNQGVYNDAYSTSSYIYGCIYLISNTIAAIPLRVIKRGDEKRKEQTDHPIYQLFEKPNFKDSMFDIKESMSANIELSGNNYLLTDRDDEKAIPTAIYSLLSNMVKPVKKDKIDVIKGMDDILKGYEYGSNRQGDNMYPVWKIIHERKYNPNDDIMGLSPIQAAALALDTTIEAKLQNFNIFKQGLSSSGSVESEQEYSDPTHKRLKLDLQEKWQGRENAHIPMVLWNGLKYKNIGINPKDLEFINGLKMNREDMCGFIYQVPLILLGVLENASYNNIKEATRIFYRFSIIPRLVKNQEVYQKLLNMFGEGYQIYFDLSKVEALQQDEDKKVERAVKLFGMGVSVEEINRLYELGIKKYDGWDKGYLPFNLVEVGSEPKEPAKPEGGEEEPPEKVVKSIKWTEEKKIAKWNVFKTFTEKIENKYKDALVPYFKAQESEILSNLDKFKSIEYKKLNDGVFTIIGDELTGKVYMDETNTAQAESKKRVINIESILWNEGEQRKKLTKLSAPYHRSALEESGKAEFDLMGLDVAFDVKNPRVTAWLQKYGLDKAKTLTGDLKDRVKKELIKGVNEGESIPDLKGRIDRLYDGYTRPKGYAVERIARTEVIGSSNQGALESYTQAGVEKKGWIAALDERTRDTHVKAHNRYQDGIKIDKDFQVGAGSGPAPGQIDAAEETINCRCSLFPIISEE